MFALRCFLLTVWFLSSTAVGLTYSLLTWGNLNINRYYAHLFSWGARKILNIRVEVDGLEDLEKNQPCIYVINHQSNLDVITFGRIYPRKTVVIGKKELIWVPFFGIFFVAGGNIVIDRKKTSKAVAGLSQAVEAIKNKGVSVWIFPEGTRNRSDQLMLPFKSGAFHMAVQAGVPIVPIVSAPLAPLFSWKEKRLTGGVLKMKILPPVQTTGLQTADVDGLIVRVREMMLTTFRGLS